MAAQFEVAIRQQELVGIERRHDPDRDQTALVAIRKRAEEDAVHGAEDGGRSADAECRCEDCGDRESWVTTQSARAVAQVLKDAFDGGLHSRLDTGDRTAVPVGCSATTAPTVAAPIRAGVTQSEP